MKKNEQVSSYFGTVLVMGLFFFILCQAMGCQGETNEKKVKEIRPQDGVSVRDIIRNPVSADNPLDTSNLAKITFDQTSIDFGQVKEGEIINQTFTFTNTGKIPLLISGAKSTCGCTVPDWPKEAVAPGESSKIDVKFNSEGRLDFQSKPISIFANTYPNKTVVYLKGKVIPKNN